ncbi:F-box protein [Camellia lanceoleosa]|uniref:F-box protein n=1 Tax=Camellia lanceoleosa TaxID=1840588 RepID=A0ACC0HZS8_9ERIC|nr:F-box protein [Camellia lanceoleosa]
MSSSGQRRRRQSRRRRLKNTVTISSAENVIGDDDLLRQILIRLPAKPLITFKLVSKRWCSLISDPFVLDNWIPPISASSFFLLRYFSPSCRIIKFNHISHAGFVNKNNKLESFKYVDDRVKISQSCKGLLLCSTCFSDLYPNSTRYYVVNPTTKEFTTIPRPTNGYDRYFIDSINLAFDPAVSLGYKIVAVLSKQWPDHNCQIGVYSSETRIWMFSDASYACSGKITFHNGVFFNGKIHWSCCHSPASIYYDLNRNQFSALPMPICLSIVPMYFGEFGGRLRLMEFYQNLTSHFHVLELKSDYSEWFVKYRIDLKMGVSAFPEMRRMCDAGWSTAFVFNVLCFLGGEVEGDLCLILYIPCKVISYNFKDRSFRKICNLELSREDIGNLRGFSSYTVHPCMETIFHV